MKPLIIFKSVGLCPAIAINIPASSSITIYEGSSPPYLSKFIQIMEHTTKAQTKSRLPLIVEKGNKYIMIHPKIDAYVPGAPGKYPIKPQVTIKRRHLFTNLDMIMEFILNITCNLCHKPLFPFVLSDQIARRSLTPSYQLTIPSKP
jgi:hypothetical protein